MRNYVVRVVQGAVMRIRTSFVLAVGISLFCASPTRGADRPEFLSDAARGTWASIEALVEPSTGLPHDTLNRVALDLFPQFAPLRRQPSVSVQSPATIDAAPCASADCRDRGFYGLRIAYSMPPGTSGSYNIESGEPFDVSEAAYIELSVKGAAGGERFEVVLWSDCNGGFPGRPESGLVTASTQWQRRRIVLADYASRISLGSLCRISVGFNDAIHTGGVLYLDDIAFFRADGSRIHISHDEETSTTNIGLYLASVVAARDVGFITQADMLARLTTALTSIEALPKWHGFPQTHNHTVSLRAFEGDRCISTVDNGYLAAGLIVLRNAVPQLAARAGAILGAMEWDWTYDPVAGLPYGCRFAAAPPSTFHYDWYAADSHFAHALGIGSGGMPASSWLNLNRSTESARCASTSHFAPGWTGGGLFMQLLPAVFLDQSGAPLGVSARAFIDDQICYAGSIGATTWGLSATVPPGGNDYCGYGCTRSDFVVPHASLLASEIVSTDALRLNLAALEALGARPQVNDGVSTADFGFVSSVAVTGAEVSPVYLILDQAMAMLGATNRLTGGSLRRYVCEDPLMSGIQKRIPEYSGGCRPLRGRAARAK
jgi:hypothetical protein